MMLPTSSDSTDNIKISDITIKSPSVIASIKLSIKSTLFRRNFDLAKDTLKEATLTLAPERPSLSSSTSLTVTVHTKGVFNRSKKFKIRSQDVLSNVAAVNVAGSNKREYRTTVDGIGVVIGFILVPQRQTSSDAHVVEANADLQPVTDEIFGICPRFRVLVVGRTDVGKTSLILNIFAVTNSEHIYRSECDINHEFFDEKKRFVLHYGQGSEAGDEDNFAAVVKFLNDRKGKEKIEDQVHAVWLCFSIPVYGDRSFETGAEKFLQLLSAGELGKMPIIAIFTKYDSLVDLYLHDASDDTGPEKVIEAEARARARLAELCVMPFREQIGGKTNIPCIPVSTKNKYNWTLYNLSRLTTELVRKYLTEDVAFLSAVAQQVNPSAKLEAVIAIWKKWYWEGLASAINSPGNQTEIVFQNFHTDVIRIWNLRDPKELFGSDGFKKLVAGLVSDQNLLSTGEVVTSSNSGSMLEMLAAVGISGPSGTTSALQQANIVLQKLITYIVSLMLIMQIVTSAITISTEGIASRHLIKIAVRTFIDSPQMLHVLSAIKQHLQSPKAFPCRDATLRKITELIESNRISTEDIHIAEIDTLIENFDIKNGEPW